VLVSALAAPQEILMKGKKVFVTGSAGFIGSHLVHALQESGARVTAFVHYNSRNDVGYLANLPGRADVDIVFGDVRDLALMRTAMQGKDVVFNLASLISVPYSYTHPQEVLETNVGGTMTCLIAARDCGVKRFLQVSSSEVYGSALYVPIDEKHPKQPQSVYAGSKIAADAMAMSFWYSYEFPVTVCRPFNTFGPRQSDRAVISNIIAQALRSNEIQLGAVDTRRDFTFVTDTAAGMIAMASADAALGEELNLGTGDDVSIRDVVHLVGEILDKKLVIVSDANRMRPTTSEVTRLLSGNQRARDLTGWAPKVTLKEGLRQTVEWIRDTNPFDQPGSYKV
jgi:NAD dependent epimerase/dehydratase